MKRLILIVVIILSLGIIGCNEEPILQENLSLKSAKVDNDSL